MTGPDTRRPESKHWRRRWRLGRLQVGFHAYRHMSPTLPDRWVFSPEFVYDRKDRRG